MFDNPYNKALTNKIFLSVNITVSFYLSCQSSDKKSKVRTKLTGEKKFGALRNKFMYYT